MNILRIKLFTLCTAVFLAFGIIGCDKGPGEKAGEKVDRALESAKDTIHEATE